MGRQLFSVESASKLRRYIPATLLVAAFLLLSALFVSGNVAAYRGILLQMGVQPFDFPFLDMHGILATAECHREGIDVLTSNPCDALGRTLDYSPFWLLAAALGIDTSMTMRAGLSLDLIFLVSVFFLPPIKSWSAAAVMIAALLSSAVALALERANLDLAVFAIAIVVAGWSLRGPAWRGLSYGLITLAALVKYYPAILLLLALRERLRFFLLLAAALVAVAALFVWIEGAMLVRALDNIETTSAFTTNFGAGNLPTNLVYHFASGTERLAQIVELVFASLAAAYAYATARHGDIRGGLQSLPPRDRNLMLMGCGLIIGCFFAAENAAYRTLYFLFILPGLAALWREISSAAARRRLMVLTGAILFLMWDQFFRQALNQAVAAFGWGITSPSHALWYLREITWWWVVSILLALLLDLLIVAIAGDSVRRDHRALENPV